MIAINIFSILVYDVNQQIYLGWAKPTGENSTFVKVVERVPSRYVIYDEVNELLKIVRGLEIPGVSKAFTSLIKIFYVVVSWSRKLACLLKSIKEKLLEHLSITEWGIGNSGLPEIRKYGGNRGLVVARLSTRQTRSYHTSAWLAKETSKDKSKEALPKGIVELEKLIKENTDTKKKFTVKGIITDPDFLMLAYSKIKSKPGSMTPGGDKTTLDELNKDYFVQLAKDISTGAVTFKPARRIEIPKAKGGTRPLSIASPRDKIVQSAMNIILQAIFDKHFSKFSHGFRPGKSCHSALYQVRGHFTEVSWFIEGDISKCFDNLSQNVIVEQIKSRISDQLFIDLVYKCFNAGYVDSMKAFKVPNVGTPQGSIVSPILCNIALDLLDKWLEDYSSTFNIGGQKKANPIYTKLMRNISSKLPSERKEIRSYIHNNRIRSKIGDPSFKRMYFVRYADDFLIGVNGSYNDCCAIRQHLSDFLKRELGLDLSIEKTAITPAKDKCANFLGFKIRITPYEKRQLLWVKHGDRMRLVAQTSRPQLLAPIREIITKLGQKEYCKKGWMGVPSRVGRLIHLPLPMIIDHYKSVGRGLLHYYACADNFTIFKHRVTYILKYSCALTFASKLRLYTMKGTFRKFGYNLKIIDKTKEPFKVLADFKDEYLTSIKKGFNLSMESFDPFSVIEFAAKAMPRVRKLFEDKCKVCGSKDNLEVHHVKHLRKTNKFDGKADYATNMMIIMNRKQITLCKQCHVKIHSGNYNGPGL